MLQKLAAQKPALVVYEKRRGAHTCRDQQRF
jgi:hypothetical protein